MKIRHKITLWVTAAGLLTSLAFSLIIYFEMLEQPFEILDGDLESTASAVAEQISRRGTADIDRWAPAIGFPTEAYWIKVYDKDLVPIYQSALSTSADLPLYTDREDDAYTVRTHLSNPQIPPATGKGEEVKYRVRVVASPIHGTRFLIQVAKPMDKLDEEISDLVTAIFIGLAVSTVLLIVVSYFLAGRIVRPLAAINRLTREINENTLEKRIPTGESRDELNELSISLNRMFDRLQYSFTRQKQYLADASHELKSPIASLRLFFDNTLQHQDLPEALRQQLHIQNHILLRMDRLVKTLLELSVLEIKTTVALGPIDLRRLVEDLREEFQPVVDDAGLHFGVEVPERLSLTGDKEKLRRMLINILDNAVKYNKPDGEIRLLATREAESIRVSVYNTGPGIPEGEREKVFDQFQRVEKSRNVRSGGAGLGLSIVREIVRLHEGRVFIESETGLWTRVNILLPPGQSQ